MREGEVESGTRDQLERRQLVGGGSARLGEESHRELDPAEPEKCRLDFARLGEELHRRGGDDPEGALATDKELLQVVAGVVLAQTSQPVPDLPIGRYDLEAQGQLAGIAVARHRDAAGVGRQIATDLAAALGAEAQWEEPVGLGGGPLQIGEDAAGLDRHREIDRVDRSDAVHAAEARTMLRPSSGGTAPPTGPVLPPCGTIGSLPSAQIRTTAATSVVEAGRTTSRVAPR